MKRLGTTFFCLFFLGAVVTEAYFIQRGNGDYISVIGIGVVLMISGYLLLDSIRSKLAEQGKSIRNYLDGMYREEIRRRDEQLTELIHIQKAAYGLTKKNMTAITAQLEEMQKRVETLELLQRKGLEGQKNILNIEINHNKMNTKQLIKAVKETGDQTETRELLQKIAESISSLQSISYQGDMQEKQKIGEYTQAQEETAAIAYDSWLSKEPAAAEEMAAKESIAEGWDDWEEENPETAASIQEETVSGKEEEAAGAGEIVTEQASAAESVSLHGDPNKALSADEIAQLFASFGQ